MKSFILFFTILGSVYADVSMHYPAGANGKNRDKDSFSFLEFTSASQRISSKLRRDALHFVRQQGWVTLHHYTRRLDETAAPCAWNDDKCEVSPKFVATVDDNDMDLTVKAYVLKAAKCSEAKDQVSCTGDCEYKNGQCNLGDKAGEKMMEDLMKESGDTCGPIVKMMSLDECSRKTQTECTEKCEWDENGEWELDAAGKSCKQMPKCKKKEDPKDPTGLGALCPDMETVKTECEAKETNAQKTDCFGRKCPIMLMFVGGLACGGSETEEKCTSHGQLCTYGKDSDAQDSKKKCEMNLDYVMDLLVPKDCWLGGMLADGMKCGQAKTESTCKDNCQWDTKTGCDSERVKTEQKCEASGDAWFSSMLGDRVARQREKCRQGTESTCASVETVQVPGIESNFGTSTVVYTIMNVFAVMLVMM